MTGWRPLDRLVRWLFGRVVCSGCGVVPNPPREPAHGYPLCDACRGRR